MPRIFILDLAIYFKIARIGAAQEARWFAGLLVRWRLEIRLGQQHVNPLIAVDKLRDAQIAGQ